MSRVYDGRLVPPPHLYPSLLFRYMNSHGDLFYRLGKCRECKHSTSDLSHDLCRSHAFCAKGSQYYGAPCSTCEDLWDRSRDFTDPEDAIASFDLLAGWIKGFRKNSKGRSPGQDHFFDPRERIRFQELHAMIANLRSKFPLMLWFRVSHVYMS